MGKQARINNRKLQEQAAMAQDLTGLQHRPVMVAGVEVRQVMLQMNIGQVPGAAVIFHMQNGDHHGPCVVDVVGALQLIAGVAGVLAGPPQSIADPGHDSEPTSPDADGVHAQDSPETAAAILAERAAASGIILA